MKIKWIGQSGYLLTDDKTTICIDPYLSDVVNKVANRPRMVDAPFLPEQLKSDVVICTHNHLDHVDVDAIPLIKKDNLLFLAPSDAKKQLIECGVINYKAFDEGTTVRIGDFELEAVFADHGYTAKAPLPAIPSARCRSGACTRCHHAGSFACHGCGNLHPFRPLPLQPVDSLRFASHLSGRW